MIRNAEHGVLTHYDPDGYYCEMMGRSGAAAEHTRPVRRILDELNLDTLRARARDAERELYNLGITLRSTATATRSTVFSPSTSFPASCRAATGGS